MLHRSLRPIARFIASGSRRYASSSSSASSSIHRNRTLAIVGTTALVFAGYASQRPSVLNEGRVDKPALEQKSLKESKVNAEEPAAGGKSLKSAQKSSDSKEAKTQKSGKSSKESGSSKPKGKPTDEAAVVPAKEVIEKKTEEANETMEDGASETQGAFNEETGEINWDCPCLGGMADGPCGEDFKAAFSCFVFSDKEPKGIDCVEKFQAMQNCFREHPEIYGEEIDDMDEEGPAPPPEEGEKDVPPSKKLPLDEK